MATELRESFPTLEDATAADAGAAKSLKAEGSSAASGGTNYDASLVGKDSSGNLQFLKQNSSQELIVTMEGDTFACLSDEGTVDDGSGTLVEVASFALQASKVYSNIEWMVSCFRDCKFIIEAVEDVGVTDVITIITQGRVGSGSFTSDGMLRCREVTAGTIGTLALRIRASNPNALSDIDATLAAREKQ